MAWFAVVGSAGWFARLLAPVTSEFLSSMFFDLYGCIGVLFTVFMPIVMLLTIAYAGGVNPRLEDAGRLVSGWPGVLRRITTPLIAPGILLAAALVFLLTFGEVGVPTFLRYPVYPVETLTQFAAFYDFRAATVAAVPMLIVTLMILALEYRFLHNRVLELSAVTLGGRQTQIGLGRWRLPVFGLVLGWALVTVALPLAVLLIQSWSLSAFAEAFSRASDSILRSVTFAVIGATLLTVLGFFCGYLVHNRTLPLWRSIDALALFLFTLPGTVIGIGLISLWNTPMIGYVFCLRDLGISMVVYPPGSDTLPVRILTLMANGAPSLIAALCTILIVVTLLPLCTVALWQRRGGRRS